MELRVSSKGKIIRNLWRLALQWVGVGLCIFVMGGWGLGSLLEQWLPANQAHTVGVIVPAICVLVGIPLYLQSFFNRLSRSRLALENDTVVICGVTRRGFVEKRYALGEVKAITLGAKLNLLERVVDWSDPLHRTKDAKSGMLTVTDRYGGREIFWYVDKIFDSDSLLRFALELSGRGVDVGGSAYVNQYNLKAVLTVAGIAVVAGVITVLVVWNYFPPRPRPAGGPPNAGAQQFPQAAVVPAGTMIQVRADIQGKPPDFGGDYNKHIRENLEIALRDLGFQPVSEGAFVLHVRAQRVVSGETIRVHNVGAAPPVRLFEPGKTSVFPKMNPFVDEYPLEQVTATLTVTDAKGVALWKRENSFRANITLFQTDNPPREMQEQVWAAFDAWARGDGLSALKQ